MNWMYAILATTVFRLWRMRRWTIIYYIDVNAEHQLILGNNARALLLGVYRYLTRIGCRFLRPGQGV